ncbi:hypothetical protein [Aquimarina longa]|uniref:hypothetical protein n=1 Tax=Aquimarina longa TaxID=1080221 RepID=UPI000785DD16|nr:hypothetical protein [Aquimarina longa]
MDINLQLKLGLVNQYLDGQISGIVKETFDDAIRNEALNEIDQRLESGFAIEKTKMLITIQMAYSGVFYSTDDIDEYIDAYIKNNVEHEVQDYIQVHTEKNAQPYDWIRNKETKEYIWDEDISSPNDSDVSDAYEYVGKTFGDIRPHFNKNASWMDKVRDFAGSGGPRINISSYIGAKLKPKIENAILSQREGYIRMIAGKNNAGGFYPKDFSISGIKRNTGYLGMGIGNYHFETIVCINGGVIPVTGTYIVKEKSNNVAQIEAKGNHATVFGDSYKNSFYFQGRGKVPTIILETKNEIDYYFIKNFIHGKN